MRPVSCTVCWLMPAREHQLIYRRCTADRRVACFVAQRFSRWSLHAQGIFLDGSNPVPTTDPAIAVGKGSASGSYTLYALLVPTSGKGSRAIVGSFVYRVTKHTFSYQSRYGTTTAPGMSTVSTGATVPMRGPGHKLAVGVRAASAVR